jgi:L-aspartate oxidase
VKDDLDAPPVVGAPEENPDASAVRTIADLDALRRAMTAGAGLVRTAEGLRSSRVIAEKLAGSASGAQRAAAVAASLICRSALERDESRGTHFRSDAPEPKAGWDGNHVTLSR